MSHEVSQIGDQWGRMKHRTVKIDRCENGYVVEFDKVVDRKTHRDLPMHEYPSPTEQVVSREKRVFITNSDMLEFVEEYFKGEPKP
jgi:hypothetical protein